MDFVEGKSLAQFLAENKRVSIDEAYSLLVQILNAIAYINSRRIVHRDIKL
jgi:serine/threonine protein kinase